MCMCVCVCLHVCMCVQERFAKSSESRNKNIEGNIYNFTCLDFISWKQLASTVKDRLILHICSWWTQNLSYVNASMMLCGTRSAGCWLGMGFKMRG